MWRAKRQAGFTIVELLIVIVVIAILAAITIVAYNGVTQRANASAAQSALSTINKKLSLYAVDNADAYPTDIASLGFVSSGTTTYQYSVNNSSTPAGFCATATVGGISYYLAKSFTYTSATTTTIDQPTPTTGACPGQSSSGSSITNTDTNPSVEVSTTGYGEPNGSIIARDTTQSHSGVASLSITLPTSAAGGTVGASLYATSAIATTTSIAPNTTYTISAYVYVPSGVVDPYITVQGSGRASKVDPAGYTTSLKDQWVRIYNTFTTNASGSIMIYVLNKTATSTTSTQYWVDDVMFTQGTTLMAYADGNSSGWVWNGTAGLSASSGPAL